MTIARAVNVFEKIVQTILILAIHHLLATRPKLMVYLGYSNKILIIIILKTVGKYEKYKIVIYLTLENIDVVIKNELQRELERFLCNFISLNTFLNIKNDIN